MIKYWYYTYCDINQNNSGITYSKDGKFPIFDIQKELDKIYGKVIISFWHEISSDQYENLYKYFYENKK